MAFLKNPIAKVVGNSNPAKLDLICEVKVEFSALDRALLQNAQNAAAFRVHFKYGGQDFDVSSTLAPTRDIGDVNVSLSMGNPDAQIFFTKTFTRGVELNEDPFPFPNQEDEIFIEATLFNLFDNQEMGTVRSDVVKGNF